MGKGARKDSMNVIRKGVALVLAVSIGVGCSAVGFSAGPRFETVQQAAGCKCGNSYISCDKECHKDDGLAGGDPTALLWLLGIAAAAGVVYLVATHKSEPREAGRFQPADTWAASPSTATTTERTHIRLTTRTHYPDSCAAFFKVQGTVPEEFDPHPYDVSTAEGAGFGLAAECLPAEPPAPAVDAASQQVEPEPEPVTRPLLDSDLASGPVVGDATVKVLYAPNCADYQWLVSSKRERAVLINSVSAAIEGGYSWAAGCTPPSH